MYRHRRLRRTPAIRRMVRENHLNRNDLIYPLFVRPGKEIKEEISAMPGQYRYSLDRLDEELEGLHALGISAVLLFGITDKKDPAASEAYNDNGLVQQAVQLIKTKWPDMWVITDVCVCSYTDHGHCGILHNQDVDNDRTLEILAKTALSHAKAGADMVAPSAMMDFQVEAIREILDEENNKDIGIMAYAAKYYSSFYGPFREAADSAPQIGNRATYQMDAANSREALMEMAADIEEGADIIMVKPALAYLDIIAGARQNFDHPVAAYNVSGEYSAIKAAAEKGWLDEKQVVLESLTAMKRAGADLIITYFAKDVVGYLKT